jgi:DNA repair exonuclease SbcCD ATPase subunit
VKLLEVIIQNFQSISFAHVFLADKGLVSIEGENLDKGGADSNGSGKSTIINAVLWCNYNDCGKARVSADAVINDKVGKDCFVQSIWDDEGTRYCITRYRKHKTGKNSVTVYQSVHGDMKDITKAGSKEVQEQINSILGQDLLTFKANCFASQEEALDIPAMTDSELKGLLERVLPFDDLNDLHKKAMVGVTDHRNVVDKLGDDIHRILIRQDYIKETAKKTVEESKDWERSVKEWDQKIDDEIFRINSTEFSCNAVNPVALKETKDDLKDLKGKVAKYDPKIYEKILWELDNIDGELNNLHIALADDTCGACGQIFSDYKEVSAHVQAKIDRLTETQYQLIKQKDKLQFNYQKYNEQLKKIVEIERVLEGLRQSELKNIELQARVDALKAQKRHGQPTHYKRTVARLKAEYDDAKVGLQKLNQELEIARQILEIKEAVAETFSPKGVRYHILEEVTPYLNNRTNHYLSLLTDGAIGAIWSTVTQTKAGEYREKFSIETMHNNVKREYGLLSGGEKRKVRLSCFFALQDLIASRATKNIEIWCGDEIDHALDTAGLERLMMLLDEKTKSKSTILVISHNQLRDWIPNFATVTRKDDISVITGYLN